MLFFHVCPFLSLSFYTTRLLHQSCSCCYLLSTPLISSSGLPFMDKIDCENCSSAPPKKHPADFCVFASKGCSHLTRTDNFLLPSLPINSGSSISFFLFAIEGETFLFRAKIFKLQTFMLNKNGSNGILTCFQMLFDLRHASFGKEQLLKNTPKNSTAAASYRCWGVTFDRFCCALASSTAPQCVTKLLPSPLLIF